MFESIEDNSSSNVTDYLRYVMVLDTMTEYLSSIICIPGSVFNAILIYLILKYTPVPMRPYAVYMMNFAVFDFVTCILSFFACQKVIFSGFSLIYIFHGPCKYISSWFCYFCHCFECHTLAHSQWILLGSFVYRYSVILRRNPTVKDLLKYSGAFYSLSFCFLIFYTFDESNSKELLSILINLHPEYRYGDENIWKNLVVSGNLSSFAPVTLISILYMTFPCVPIYCAILYFRHKTLTLLNNPGVNLSPVTKTRHQKLFKALTLQAAIPILWLISSFIYTMAQFGLIGGPIPENITFRLMDCIPMMTPLVTIFFIQPYREGLSKMFHIGTRIFVPFTVNNTETMPTRNASSPVNENVQTSYAMG